MLRRIQRAVAGMAVAAITCGLPVSVLAQQPATQAAATKPATRATTLATTAPATAPTAATRPADVQNVALAERLAYQMAQGLLRARPITAQSWPASVALLEGALRLNPDEPRIMRLLIEALLREGDTTRALEVLTKYRGTEEGRDDQGAQVQSIELYVAQLDTLEKKIEYLKDVVARAGIFAPVRSHAAVRAAELLAEHMQDAEALQMVDQALRANPLNIRALRIKYELLKTGTPSERLAGMLEMLKSNPAQPALALAVAQDLADAGLVQPSLQWYVNALNMYFRAGQQPERDVMVDYGAELFIGGDAKSADQVAQRLTAADPDSFSGWLMRLVILKTLKDSDGVTGASRQAQVALTNRLAMLRRAAGDQTATTRPVDPATEVPAVDVAADLTKIQGSKNPELINGFAVVAQSMAWLKIYFDEKPADADPWLNGLIKVVGAQDPTLNRLQGWQLLKAGKLDQARAKLQPVAANDPLAAAGLLLINPAGDAAANDKANSEARALISNNPSGITGAVLLEMLSPRNVRLVPGQVADQLQAELMRFPRDWMRIIDAPQESYALRLEPVRSALQVGDPVLVRVTIMNISDFDLTVGPDGVLHQDLWFDAQLRGAQQQVLQSESFDRITKRLVLSARQTMSQVVRLDSAALSGMLLSNPQRTFQLSAMVMTNPVTVQGQVTSGLAGFRAQIPQARMMERQGSPITSEQVRTRLNKNMIDGSPSEKVQVVELVATYYQVFSGAEDPQTKQLGAPFGEAVRKAATDFDPGTRAWALYVLSLLSEQDRPAVVKTMVQDPGWHGRLLSCVTVALTGTGKDLIKPLEQDDDPIVAKLAKAVGQMKLTPRQAPPGAGPGSAPPATRPTSGPADTGTPTIGGGAVAPGAAPAGAAPAGATTPPTISLPSAAPGGTPSLSTSAPPTTSPAVP